MNKFIKDFLISLSILIYISLVAFSVSTIISSFGHTLTALSIAMVAISLLVALFMWFRGKAGF